MILYYNQRGSKKWRKGEQGGALNITMKIKEAFDTLLENTELGYILEVKQLDKEVSIEDIEKFISDIHRNSLILFNKIHDMKENNR